ncbi:A/G-specific adenine glycosylase [Staphylococcus sp. 17KM0847]|uniref:A/G-specific adenine glycosylase n=1 Tax=Staphylococcus sp. 17KM0847 TaxID=2583989 RepID=UPI0015DCC924|nr:A/G-specific adenine glycosylase [Staphylococcus sp. 17KM0847]QLK86368.1 A/G-specific adenine glycosylase [Staphylococcus sp. 17KM0847]
MYFEDTFKEDLVAWFKVNQRSMPWRETSNPYYIWVSEVMLQQTQVDTVRSYYERFIKHFPTIEALAYADEAHVLKLWEGLGYYSRARNFHAAAQEVVTRYNGEIPPNPEQFAALKGVGPYTQAAVMSIAFDLPLATVDGNVFRVWSRLNDDIQDTALQKTRKAYEHALEPYVQQHSGTFNQAMMELGALVCTPKAPMCLLCPVQHHCESFDKGTVYERPIKTKKLKKKQYKLIVLYIENQNGDILIEQRKTKLLNGMWQFPVYEEDIVDRKLEEEFGDAITIVEKDIYQLKHQFTHITWNMTVHHAKIISDSDKMLTETRRWITPEDKRLYTFPVPMTKIYEVMQ